MDETALIKSAQKGDVEAFNQLVLQYQDLVYNHACATLGEPELAEDISQEVFIKAYRGLANFRGGSLRAWLLRIATNACYDEFRRRSKQSVVPLAEISPDDETFDQLYFHQNPGYPAGNPAGNPADNPAGNPVEAHLERAEIQAAIQRGLAALPAEYRMAAVIIDVLGFNYAEASRSLGVPLGTVKSRLARARQGLREYLNGALEMAG
jgi:RNA polymerase sigma-70 factor (ECF subfamily)